MIIAEDVGVNEKGERIMKYCAGFTFQGIYDEFDFPKEGVIKDMEENILYEGKIEGNIIEMFNNLENK